MITQEMYSIFEYALLSKFHMKGLFACLLLGNSTRLGNFANAKLSSNRGKK